jgi:hypothetical protein
VNKKLHELGVVGPKQEDSTQEKLKW